MSENNVIKTLQGISFLRDIDPVHLQQIATIAEIRVYDTNDILFHEGQPAEYVLPGCLGKNSAGIVPRRRSIRRT